MGPCFMTFILIYFYVLHFILITNLIDSITYMTIHSIAITSLCYPVSQNSAHVKLR